MAENFKKRDSKTQYASQKLYDERISNLSSKISASSKFPIKTVFIKQKTYLLGMNIFEIGGNKAHINLGLMGNKIADEISPQIKKISKDTTHIAIPGYVLKLLEEYDESTLKYLQSLVKKNNISLLLVPYYNSSVSLVSKDELNSQFSKQEESYKQYFSKQSEGFFCSEGILPPVLEESLNSQNISQVFYPKNSSLTINNPNYKLTQTLVSVLGEEISNITKADSQMESHLITELIAMQNQVLEYGDEDSQNSLRFMTQPSMITRANVNIRSNDAYEHYTQMMNTLNDIAHKMNVIQLAKKGLFQEKPLITDSPSKIFSMGGE